MATVSLSAADELSYFFFAPKGAGVAHNPIVCVACCELVVTNHAPYHVISKINRRWRSSALQNDNSSYIISL